MRNIIFSVTLFLITFTVSAQKSVRDSIMTIPVFYGTYGLNLTGGDYSKRFGPNSEVGGGFMLKTKNNWLIFIESTYIFGGKIREKNVFGEIISANNSIIGQDGLDADVRIFQRGGKLPLIKIGKIIPFKIGNASKNSGFFACMGWGILHHKIKIEDVTNTAPQVTGDYAKGYDRLTNGTMLVENIGYLYLDRKRYVNVFAMLEFTQGFTKNRRIIDFATGIQDTKQRLDLLYGFKFGIGFPIYKKLPDEYYIY
jgi:hypothetical protein